MRRLQLPGRAPAPAPEPPRSPRSADATTQDAPLLAAVGQVRELLTRLAERHGPLNLVDVYPYDRSAGRGVVVVVVERAESAVPDQGALRRAFGLTTREAQVACLLAERRSNREIGEMLGVTVHTVRRHTERVLAKLEVRSRRDVASRLRALGTSST